MVSTIQLEAPVAQVPGGFWKRLVAVIVDGVILSIAMFPLSFLLAFGVGLMVASSGGEPNPALVALMDASSSLAGFIAAFFYYGWFYSNKGASPGKMLLRLRVSSHETGTNLSFSKAGLRETIGKFVSAVILLIGYLMAAFRQDKRALHDFLFGSQVTHEPK